VSIATSRCTIRELQPGDRVRVEEMTRGAGLFSGSEISIALEVFDDATGANPAGTVDPDYESAGVEVNGHLVGWAVWGPRPGEPATFDLYWIVVDPPWQRNGLGRILHDHMEERIEGRAEQVLVETSGRPDYERTREFYERHGYRAFRRVADFYGPGDDQVVYVRALSRAGLHPPLQGSMTGLARRVPSNRVPSS